MRAPDWLTARPVAHRGLHDRGKGVIENTLKAAQAAIDGNFTIELDLQLSADGEAMVYHDHDLARLTDGTGLLRSRTAAELKQLSFRGTPDRLPTFAEFLDLVGGRVPLLVELKSFFDGDRALIARAAKLLAAYRGPAAVMSFDPDVVAAIRALIPDRPRGITAERRYDDSYWSPLPREKRDTMLYLRHGLRTQPHFVAYRVDDLPAPPPWIARNLFGCALLAWTVRTPQQRARAAAHADQMIFEGFVP